MKNLIKKLALIASSLALVLSLGGCTNYAKQQVLSDYMNSLSDDSVQWTIIGEASNKLQTSSDINLMVAGIQSSVLPGLEKIVENGEKRNASITDPEILAIDNHYLGMAKNLKAGFELIVNGVYQKDTDEMNKAMVYLNAAVDDAKGFVDEFDAYTTRYDINTSGSMDEFRKQIEEFEGIK